MHNGWSDDTVTGWITWNINTTTSLVIGLGVFLLNITCLIIMFVWLNRKIDHHTCKSCLKEPTPLQETCDSNRENHPTRTPVTLTKDDSDSSSDESDNFEVMSIPQKEPSKNSLTYTTIQFNVKSQCGDYVNLHENSDYVNVDPKEKRNQFSKHRIQGSVDYTDILEAAASYKIPSHPPLTDQESSSS